MFIASIDYVYEQASEVWRCLLDEYDESADTAERLPAQPSPAFYPDERVTNPIASSELCRGNCP